MEKRDPNSTAQFQQLLRLYINTFIGASFAELFTYPLDVTKTRLHLQGEAAEKSAAATPKRGMVGTMFRIAREEGLHGVYGGLSCMIIRNLVFNAPRVVIYDFMRHKLIYVDENGKAVLTFARGFLSGCVAGCIAQSAANPLDIVKIRMQLEGRRRSLGHPVRVSTVPQALRRIYAEGGARSLWRGLGPSCLRATLITAGDTACYDLSKRQFMWLLNVEDGRLIQILSSLPAGLVASVFSTPIDVVKSRVMNQPRNEQGQGKYYKSGFDCFHKLVTQEGIFAMFKGFMPCWLRIGPWSIIFWIAFEQMLRFQGQTSF